MKQVAESLKKLVFTDEMQVVLNRSNSDGIEIDAVATELLDHWSYDLYSRRPGPAYYENGALQPTDLDLACFLSALVDRKAVINLPTYKATRARTDREGERVLSKENRHGAVSGLVSNKDVFSFSLRILDQNVMVAGDESRPDRTGAFRSFMLVGLDGKWNDGWRSIEFMPSARENDFLKTKGLWTENKVVFKNFVHPNRWVSFFGSYFLLTKALIRRLEDENVHARAQVKSLLASGLRLPTDDKAAESDYSGAAGRETETAVSKPITCTAFECEVDVPWRGAFVELGRDVVSLAMAKKRLHERQYYTLPALRFAARCTELAFYQAGMNEAGFPAWVKGAAWEPVYKEPGKRTAWKRLVLTQLMPGERGVALRYRTWAKTERVADADS